MFHEGSLVLYFPFGPLPLSLNPLKTVYSPEKGIGGEREIIRFPASRLKYKFLGHTGVVLQGHRKLYSAWVLKKIPPYSKKALRNYHVSA